MRALELQYVLTLALLSRRANMEISPKVHLIPNIIANPYLIVDADGLTLVDAGLPGNHGKILRYIRERGFKDRDLVRIIITHSDTDHVGSLAALKRASGARVYASAIEAAAIAAGKPSRQIRPRRTVFRMLMSAVQRFVRATPVTVDEIVADGQSLPVLGGLTVLETPGHTPGHISLFSPATGVLFCGDSMVVRDGQLVSSLAANTWDQAQAVESVRKQSALHPNVVCSGHGPVVTDAAKKMPAV
jgi:glyoxylase-like metal-dependent hydrolase (beta-lactamase superfamily II)